MKNHINSIVITLGVIIAAYFLGSSYLKRGKIHESVSVTGAGEESFTSDLIVWRAGFERKSMDLKKAYGDLAADRSAILKYLKKKGVSEDEVIFEAVDIRKDYYYDYDDNGYLRSTIFNGYNLSQSIKVQSSKVDLVEKISREAAELIDVGVEINSYPPSYYYTKLAELKIKMIEAATRDAKNRAETIVKNAAGSLGVLKNAEMGVFQITGENSDENYSWGGSFNTSSKKKTASITIRLRYEVR